MRQARKLWVVGPDQYEEFDERSLPRVVSYHNLGMWRRLLRYVNARRTGGFCAADLDDMVCRLTRRRELTWHDFTPCCCASCREGGITYVEEGHLDGRGGTRASIPAEMTIWLNRSSSNEPGLCWKASPRLVKAIWRSVRREDAALRRAGRKPLDMEELYGCST